jgi:hypothetical protein
VNSFALGDEASHTDCHTLFFLLSCSRYFVKYWGWGEFDCQHHMTTLCSWKSQLCNLLCLKFHAIFSLIEKFLVKKLLLHLGYTVFELSFEGFQKLLRGRPWGLLLPVSTTVTQLFLYFCVICYIRTFMYLKHRNFSIPIFKSILN